MTSPYICDDHAWWSSTHPCPMCASNDMAAFAPRSVETAGLDVDALARWADHTEKAARAGRLPNMATEHFMEGVRFATRRFGQIDDATAIFALWDEERATLAAPRSVETAGLRKAVDSLIDFWDSESEVLPSHIDALRAALPAAPRPEGLTVARLAPILTDAVMAGYIDWDKGNNDTTAAYILARLSDTGDHPKAAPRSVETAGDGRHPDEVYADELERKQRDLDALREEAQAVVKAWEHPGAFTVVDPAIKALDAALRAAAPRSVETAGHVLSFPPHPDGLYIGLYISSALCSCGDFQWDADSAGALLDASADVRRDWEQHALAFPRSVETAGLEGYGDPDCDHEWSGPLDKAPTCVKCSMAYKPPAAPRSVETAEARKVIERLPVALAFMDGDAEERGAPSDLTLVVSKDAVLAALDVASPAAPRPEGLDELRDLAQAVVNEAEDYDEDGMLRPMTVSTVEKARRILARLSEDEGGNQ